MTNPRFDWDDEGVIDRDGITLVVADWPYCGVGSYFCVELDVPEQYPEGVGRGKPRYAEGPFSGTEKPLVMSLANTFKNRTLFDVGKQWTLRPKEAGVTDTEPLTYEHLMTWCEANDAVCSLGCDDEHTVTTTIGEYSTTDLVYRCRAEVDVRGVAVTVGNKDTMLEAMREAVRIASYALAGGKK